MDKLMACKGCEAISYPPVPSRIKQKGSGTGAGQKLALNNKYQTKVTSNSMRNEFCLVFFLFCWVLLTQIFANFVKFMLMKRNPISVWTFLRPLTCTLRTPKMPFILPKTVSTSILRLA